MDKIREFRNKSILFNSSYLIAMLHSLETFFGHSIVLYFRTIEIKDLMMFKLQVITPLCVLSFLQVFSQEAGQPKLSCASLCEQVDSGYAGICCGMFNRKLMK